jgi:hypothetical protein
MNAIGTLILMIPFLAPILLANLAERERSVRALTITYLVLLNGMLIVLGLFSWQAASMLADGTLLSMLQGQNAGLNVDQLRAVRLDQAGLALIAGSIGGMLALSPAIQGAASRILPMRAGNIVHATALSLTATAFGLNAFQMFALSPVLFAAVRAEGGVEQLQQLGSASFLDVLVFPLLTLVVAALLGVGLYVRRTQDEVLARLGLSMPPARHIALSVGVTIGFLGLAILTEAVWRAVDPIGLQVVGGVSQALLGNLDSPLGALAIGASAAIGEETFFRGAHQPRMGIVLSTLLFASFHVQYGITPATGLVLMIGFVLGALRERTSLTVCILVHFLYNFTSVLLS